jgi:hypothetical protein
MTNSLLFLQCFKTHAEAVDWTTKIKHPVLIIYLVRDDLNLFTVLSKEDIEVLKNVTSL